MGLESYTQDLPGVMKLLDNYITERRKNRNLMKTSGKEQTGLAFTHKRRTKVKRGKKKNKGE